MRIEVGKDGSYRIFTDSGIDVTADFEVVSLGFSKLDVNNPQPLVHMVVRATSAVFEVPDSRVVVFNQDALAAATEKNIHMEQGGKLQ